MAGLLQETNTRTSVEKLAKELQDKHAAKDNISYGKNFARAKFLHCENSTETTESGTTETGKKAGDDQDSMDNNPKAKTPTS